VNPQATAITSLINLSNISASRVNGIATVLTSSSALDENSFSTPNLIAPYSSGFDTIGSTLKYTFLSNSVTILKINTTNSTSINTIKKKTNQLSVYPNPAKNFVYINSENSGNTYIQVQDIAGQIVIKKQIVKGKVDISALPPGIYILTAQLGNKLVSTKLLKELE
jgi:DNA-binding beta-propeller fold protein YncE